MLPLNVIPEHVAVSLADARQHPDITIELTLIGCGLAGYRPEQVAPLLANAPSNPPPAAFAVNLEAQSYARCAAN